MHEDGWTPPPPGSFFQWCLAGADAAQAKGDAQTAAQYIELAYAWCDNSSKKRQHKPRYIKAAEADGHGRCAVAAARAAIARMSADCHV